MYLQAHTIILYYSPVAKILDKGLCVPFLYVSFETNFLENAFLRSFWLVRFWKRLLAQIYIYNLCVYILNNIEVNDVCSFNLIFE
jgi:hypothetical protein